uniref:Uncharacterized protein n=1 Tax=Anguilla anguilla TaxID=7936 RepID=A0A0E9TJD9_ANGAN
MNASFDKPKILLQLDLEIFRLIQMRTFFFSV